MSTAEEAQYHRIRREFTSVDGASLPTAASAAGGGAQSSNNTKEPTDLNGEDDFNPGWAPGEATTSTSSQPKVSFNITSSEQKAVDRVVAFDDLNGDDDEPQPQQPRAAPVASSESVRYQQAHAPMIFMTPLRNRESFQGGAAGSILDMKDSPTNRMKSSPSGKFALPEKIGTLKEDERALRGLHLLGDFGPGDFFGHASLMKDTPHEHSIVATSACTVFVLSKAVIYKLIHAEPVVGLKLQEALGLAISAQAECLGQVHRRHNRAEFLRYVLLC